MCDSPVRARWVAEGVTEHNIERSLAPVKDRSWVVDQCLSSLAADAHVQSLLLQYGLAETAGQLRHSRQSPEGDDASEERHAALEWVGKRLHLLQHRERLETLQRLSPGYIAPSS